MVKKDDENPRELKEYVDDFFKDLQLYDDRVNGHYYTDLLKAVIDAFLQNENPENAREVYETFFMIYQITSHDKSELYKNKSFVIDNEPNTLLDLVELMRQYEENTGPLIDKQRDHFVHSVNVFILGLAIYSQNSKYQRLFKNYVLKSKYDKYYRLRDLEEGEEPDYTHVHDEEFLYRWGIASLFHDIGYPVEIIGKQLNKFVKKGIKSISVDYDVDTAIDFKDFDEFNAIRKIRPNFADNYRNAHEKSKFLDMFKPTDIMAHKISEDIDRIDLNVLLKNLNSFVQTMNENGFIDHGFFSSILVLNSYGNLIQRFEEKNPGFFFYPIVDSASAILLHNYFRNVLHKRDEFDIDVLDATESPLAYLLILCDELQEWNRRPYGEKDIQKTHANDMIIDVNDHHLYITYVLNAGSLGLGFSEDKESLLTELLSIKPVFKNGLSVNTEMGREEDFISQFNKNDAYSPYVLLSNIEKLAEEVHNDYNDTIRELYEKKKENNEEIDEGLQEKYDNIKPYEELSPEFKLSNIRSAKAIPVKLSMIGCEIAPIPENADDEKEYEKEYFITGNEIEDLAKFEHERWLDEKRANGWKYGEKRDDAHKIHPSLLEWDDLIKIRPDEVKKDEQAIKAIPKVLKVIGMRVVKSKLKLLAHEKHNFYANEKENVVPFEELPDDVQYLNYKQTYFMVKILKELGLDLVPIDHEGDAVKVLTHDQIEYLAKRDHESWYENKLNLAYRYDPSRGELTNPNIKPWDELPNATKELNKNTYVNLLVLCENVGLKIIKSE